MKPDQAIYPSLRNKVVFITGGASGIGAAFVRSFVRQGSFVSFVDIDRNLGTRLSEEVTATAGGGVLFQECDVRDLNQLQRAMEVVHRSNGVLDILINSAADDSRHTLEELTIAMWNEKMAVNLNHMVFAAKLAAEQMSASGSGSIINVGSICWKLPNVNVVGYAVAKAAIHGLTRSLAKELGRRSIRVNTVCPGWVMTEKQKRFHLNAESEKMLDLMQCLPIRIAPEDIAAMALFLASDDARACTAQEFIVDAGWV